MFTCDRRAAEKVTTADHKLGVRRRMDPDHQVCFTQNQLQRTELERGDTADKNEIRVKIPSPPQSNKFRTRSYDRPWVQGVSANRKNQQQRTEWERADAPEKKEITVKIPSPPQSNKFKTRSYDRPWVQGVSANRKVSEVRNTLNKGAVSRLPAIGRGSQGRAAELAGSSKTPWRAGGPLAPHCKEPSSPWQKPRSVDLKNKWPTQGKPFSPIRTQSQDTPPQALTPPQPLTPPGRFNPDWPRLPSLRDRPPSPDDFQIPSPAFEGFSSGNSSVVEEDSRAEGAHREDLIRGSADIIPSYVAQSISSVSPSSTRTLESSLSDSDVSSLGSSFSSLDLGSSDSDGEVRETASSWQAAVGEGCYVPVQWTGSQTSFDDIHRLYALTPGTLQSQLGREISSPESSVDSDSSPTPSFLLVGQASVSSSSAVTDRIHSGTLTTPEQMMALYVAYMQMGQAPDGNGLHPQEAQSARASDPETLRKIKESLLEESSDEEGDQCRICQCGAVSPTNPLLTPCQCSGSLQYVHQECLKRWIQTQIQSGTTLSAIKTCELCKESLSLDLDNFDVDEFYQRHNYTQVDQDSQELLEVRLFLSYSFPGRYSLQTATGTSSLEASTHTWSDEAPGEPHQHT